MTVPAMTNNLLAMPLAILTVETGNNEDWIDSVKYLVDDDSTDPPQLDIRGIKFEMEVRHKSGDHQVVISASTEDGSLAIGDAPNYGFLIINVDHEQMLQQKAGKYTADIVGSDTTIVRVVIQIDLTIFEGITR